MALMSGNACKDSLRDLKVNVVAFGKRSENQREHELTAPAIEAVAFAIPTDTKGITYLHGAPAPDFRRFVGKDMDPGNPQYGVYNLAHIFFNEMFLPWDRVFMAGEAGYTHRLVSQTAPTFRCVTTSCKCGHRDLLMGGAAVIADYNGVGKAGHVSRKLTDILCDGKLAEIT